MAGRWWGIGGRAESFAAALNGEAHTTLSDSDLRLLGVVARLRAFPAAPAAMSDASRVAVLGAAALTATHFAPVGAAAAPAAAGVTVGAGAATAGASATASSVGILAALAHVAAPILAGTAAAAIAAAGVGVAADRSTPGQPFYQLKKATEHLQLDLASGSQDAAKVRLGFAAARLSEIDKLTSKDASPLTQRRIAALLDEVRANLSAAAPALLHGSLGDQRALQRALDRTSTVLNSVATKVPAALEPLVGTTLNVNGAPNGPGLIPLPSASASAGISGVPTPTTLTPPPAVISIPIPPPIALPPSALPSDLGGLVDGLLDGLPPTTAPSTSVPTTTPPGGLLCQVLHLC